MNKKSNSKCVYAIWISSYVKNGKPCLRYEVKKRQVKTGITHRAYASSGMFLDKTGRSPGVSSIGLHGSSNVRSAMRMVGSFPNEGHIFLVKLHGEISEEYSDFIANGSTFASTHRTYLAGLSYDNHHSNKSLHDQENKLLDLFYNMFPGKELGKVYEDE